jgi:hypothetical protein
MRDSAFSMTAFLADLFVGKPTETGGPERLTLVFSSSEKTLWYWP